MAVSMSTGLCLGSLRQVPAAARPAVRPDAVAPGIVHLGLGAFHRAHQALYTEEAIAAAGGDWGIIGVAPRSREILQQLVAQDRLYSIVTISAEGAFPRVVGSLRELRHAASDPLGVIAQIANPAVRIVTLTVTEKAYRLDPGGRLQVDDALLAELAGTVQPASIPGLLARGLIARQRAEAGPIAVVSCDNLQANGERLRGVMEQAMAIAGGTLGTDVTFPSTMVDRIVPATTDQTRRLARDGLGVADLVPVAGEPFRQWVIEDRFPGGRPAWDQVGAVLTDDVAPWEALKLRILNAVHSAIAYLGALAGQRTVAEALMLPGMRAVLARFIAQDVTATLAPPEGQCPIAYGEAALDRFTNPTIGHTTIQIAMDGSQKLPYRLLGTIADQRRAGRSPRLAALVLAAWMRFVRGIADDGTPLPLNDPLAERIRQAVASGPDTPEGLADALFGLREIFHEELADDPVLRAVVVEWLAALDRHGAAATVRGEGDMS
ncbi:MAG: mannitol dehydrogenase family protein [Dactylosporangium sp.]|nr:mannitol dehydrogenase family protein [Dactylosporangium sp.]NNJ61635.1 mannitol dehydrogenase family protein [Dactylosporangium sp.]